MDFLIGIGYPSWHPERVEKVSGDGDWWIYREMFGTCLGGRLPGVHERTRKSNLLFTVNQVYHVTFRSKSVYQQSSHELEYCSRRVSGYFVPEESLKLASIAADENFTTADHFMHKSIVADQSLHASIDGDQA